MIVGWHKVKRLADADAVFCADCGVLIAQRPVMFWDIDKSKWLHENGTKHKTYYVAFDWPEPAIVDSTNPSSAS